MTFPAAVSVVFAALGAAAVAIAAPQTTTSAQPQPLPRFPTQSELVTFDVVVLGPDGKPVSGLTRDDFVVKEDGKAQAITAFEAVEAKLPALESPRTVASGPAPSRAYVATNVAGPPTRRTFAIVFDDLHVNDIHIEDAKRAVAAFLSQQAQPGDRLLLLTVSNGRYWSTTRGAEDASFLEALRRVRSHQLLPDGPPACAPTYYEAMQIEAGNRWVQDLVGRRFAALCLPPTMRPSAEQLARSAIVSDLQGSGVTPSSGPAGSAGSAGVGPQRGPFMYGSMRGSLAGTLRVVREMITRLGADARDASRCCW